MAASNEEQLLNELLRDLRKADQRLDAAGLEARVVSAFVAKPTAPRTTVRISYLAAAAAAIVVALMARGSPELGPLPVVEPPVHSSAAINTPV
jgi:hypothetical protein